MQTLKPADVKSIEQFFQLKQDSLLKVMKKYLSSKYKTVYATEHYVVAVGDIPVALVAHLDTVFPTPPENIFYDRVKNVMWSPDGLGADDRAGVYSIVQILKRGLKPTVILTTEEESGAIGAQRLIADHPVAPTELKYIIQLDRRGSVDCVFYDCENPDFEEYIEDFGFVTAFGTFSDISVICPAWKIAGVNLSIGYIDEHSYSELLYVGNMIATITKVEKMLRDAINLKEIFTYIPSKVTAYYSSKFGSPSEEDFDWDPSYGISKSLWKSWHSSQDMMICQGCNNKEYDYNLFPIKTIDNSKIFLCSECVGRARNINWCSICQDPFLSTNENRLTSICYECAAAKEEYNDTNTEN